MSHFSLLVITDQKPTEQTLEKALMPFHEFECTGLDNEYVQNIDRTEEAREEFQNSERRRYKDPQGELHDPCEDRFYRDPTEDEIKEVAPIGTGFGKGLSWTSKDWGDGKGYRAKINFLPEGWEEVSVSTSEVESFAEWVSGYYGGPIIKPGDIVDPKANDELKWGWVKVDEKGQVLEVIDRTNPNQKWDWWVVGGRWSGFLTPKAEVDTLPQDSPNAPKKGRPGLLGSEANPAGVDMIRKGDVDFDAMRAAARSEASERWQKIRAITGDLSDFVTWDQMRERHPGNIETARKAYHEQAAKRALAEAAKKDGSRDLIWISLDEFAVSHDRYVESKANSATVAFAALKDGQWVERGEMGWWGCVSDEKDKDVWNRDFNAMLDALPDDSWLTVVDCHI
ncbi:MAG TPA: hypothetical protein VFX91_00630 [Alcanivorax sp.]|nr:hypothetical protein [Alcanivorax sp.]